MIADLKIDKHHGHQPQGDEMNFLEGSGSIWQAPNLLKAIIQALPSGQFCLMSLGESYISGVNVFCVITDENGKWQYNEDELPERLKNWKRLSWLTVEFVNLIETTNPREG